MHKVSTHCFQCKVIVLKGFLVIFERALKLLIVGLDR